MVKEKDRFPTVIIIPRGYGVNNVVIFDGMMGKELIGPFRVLQGLNLSADISCAFLENSLEPWLDNLPLVGAEEDHLHAW